MRLTAHGIALELPSGWEGRIKARPASDPARSFAAGAELPVAPIPERRLATVHAANFALPVDDGEFGTVATARMPGSGAFATLVEYQPDANLIPGQGLFASRTLPLPLAREQFSPATLLRALPGQEGSQHFFTIGERPFCLYAVLGSRVRAPRLLAELNGTLASLAISAG